MKTTDEVCSYLEGYIDGMVMKRLEELESRIAKLEKQLDKYNTKKSKSESTKKDNPALRKALKLTIKELAENDETHSADLDAVCSKLKTMNYDRIEIEQTIEKMRCVGEILLPKNNRIKLVA